jgi:hypothetical protein
MATVLPHPKPSASSDQRPSLDLRFLAWFYLRALGFLASTLLLSWGCFVLLFLALGGFSLDGMMAQLANLADRYVHADAARVASFKTVVLVAQALLAAALIVLRRHHFLPPVDDRSPRHG